MEPKKTSRKRKQPPSDVFSGIFTRNKSEKYLHHRTRSGKFRPDPVRKTSLFPHPHSSLTNPKSPFNQRSKLVDDNGDGVCPISIKDLRARRVFSKPPQSKANPSFDSELNSSISVESTGKSDGLRNLNVDLMDEGSNGGNPSLLIPEKCDTGRYFEGECASGGNPSSLMLEKCVSGVDFANGGNPNLSLTSIRVSGANDDEIGLCSVVGERLWFGKAENFDGEFDCSAQKSNIVSPNLRDEDLKHRTTEDSERLGDVNLQSTPPDAVVLVSPNDDRSFSQNRNGASKLPLKETSPTKDGCIEGKKIFPNYRRNLVLNPCSRLKVFKASNSFSYRRLLPYLMDLAKDTSCAPKANPCPKTEINVEEKHLVSSSQEKFNDTSKLDEEPLATVLGCTSQGVSVGRKEEEKLPLDPKVSDSNGEKAAILTPIYYSLGKNQVSLLTPESQIEAPTENTILNPIDCSLDKNQVSLSSPESQLEAPMENDTHKGGPLNDEKVSSDYLQKLGDVSPIVESNLAALSYSPEASPEASFKEATLELKTEEGPVSVFHSSSQLEAVVSLGSPVVGLSKGILKRNPRGCRGICNCLNCASFRLNAEKAFEFSRNQLHDAEELALDLMKELSALRFILEKPTNGAKDHAIVPVNQVQEACRRASNVEDMARGRLSQMNEDLYVHCRTKSLKRPRVNFSNHVEEKVARELTK